MAQITLAAARVAKGWKQTDLAQKMGVSRETVIAWENGQRPMKTAYFYLFCKITGFSEDDIILPTKST